MSPKLKCHQNRNVTKTEMSPKHKKAKGKGGRYKGMEVQGGGARGQAGQVPAVSEPLAWPGL